MKQLKATESHPHTCHFVTRPPSVHNVQVAFRRAPCVQWKPNNIFLWFIGKEDLACYIGHQRGRLCDNHVFFFTKHFGPRKGTSDNICGRCIDPLAHFNIAVEDENEEVARWGNIREQLGVDGDQGLTTLHVTKLTRWVPVQDGNVAAGVGVNLHPQGCKMLSNHGERAELSSSGRARENDAFPLQRRGKNLGCQPLSAPHPEGKQQIIKFLPPLILFYRGKKTLCQIKIR